MAKATKTPATKVEAKHAEKAPTEREQAKALGISLPGLRVLVALVKAKAALSYREIQAATGYYAVLSATLRASYEGSLGAAKYVVESEADGLLRFKATAAGVAALKKAK